MQLASESQATISVEAQLAALADSRLFEAASLAMDTDAYPVPAVPVLLWPKSNFGSGPTGSGTCCQSSR